MHNLKNWFEKANLPLSIENNSLSTSSQSKINPNIFQIGIGNKKTKKTGLRG